MRWAKSMGYQSFWIGLNDKGNEDEWKWESGAALSSDWGGWRSGQPGLDNVQDEDCAIANCGGSGFVCDTSCEIQRQFVCQNRISGESVQNGQVTCAGTALKNINATNVQI